MGERLMLKSSLDADSPKVNIQKKKNIFFFSKDFCFFSLV